MTAGAASPFRRTRVLLALGPLAGTLGAFLGVSFGLRGLSYPRWPPSDDLHGLVLAFSVVSGLATLAAVGIGRSRGRPMHALDVCATTAVALFFPGFLMGTLISAMGV